MAFDVEAYRKGVVDPARKQGVPNDLFTRYALDEATAGDKELFEARVEEVTKYWRTLKLKKTHAAVADALLAAHAELKGSGQLTLAAFRERRERAHKEEQEYLDRLVTALAAANPCISETMVGRLISGTAGAAGAGSGGGALDATTVRAALKRHNLRVMDREWKLPVGPPPSQARSLREPLAVLGLRLSADVVFGAERVRAGFRLRDGFRLVSEPAVVDEQEVTRARQARARAAQDERQTAAENIFVIILGSVRSPAGYDTLIGWEVVEALRGGVEAGLPARAIADQAASLGLVLEEAEELAVTLAEAWRGGAAGSGNAVQEIHDALAAGRLRAARQLAAALPDAERAEMSGQVEAAEARVRTLLTGADEAWSRHRPEETAALLAEAAEIAADHDDIQARLRAIPPPPPPSVEAGADGTRVSVRWAPSPARTGEVAYRLVRATGRAATTPDAGEPVAETPANTAVDETAPLGERVFYTVFATRTEGIWSPGADAAAVLLTPEVRDLVLATDAESVTGTWRAHPGIHEVNVRRTERGMTGRGTRPTSVTATGFTDMRLRSGTAYQYRIEAVYLGADGARRVSAGLVVTARPERPPEAVSDLAVELPTETASSPSGTSTRSDGLSALVVWTPPTSGTVQVRMASAAPRWAAGTTVSAADVSRHGVALPGAPVTRADGRVALPVRPRHGRAFLTAVTCAAGGSVAVVGATVPISLADAVRGLTAARFGDAVRLRWDWPEGASLARVQWYPAGSTGDGPTGEVEIRPRRYIDSGGLEIQVGSDPVTVAVRTVTGEEEDRVVSPPVTVLVPGRGVEVTYELRPARLPWPRRAVLEVVCDRTCRLPPLVVVGRSDGILPLSATHGTALARLPARDVTARKRALITLPAPRRGAWGLACFVDPTAPPEDANAQVTLVRARRRR
ncbi:hypothetical protein [Parafrankia sp. BMG5.11]|uniref:hypothetical protein n=1 Tax=Parafrankia sp. BMG5.11 TaxID=222540 RepID=UPI00103ADDD9|nr:hypothetical protein [Parafrankia sp. BMG5.11]TCJ35615.1 hypothetical protein E0504_27415 [Parafrankia sp. BMG5.11]